MDGCEEEIFLNSIECYKTFLPTFKELIQKDLKVVGDYNDEYIVNKLLDTIQLTKQSNEIPSLNCLSKLPQQVDQRFVNDLLMKKDKNRNNLIKLFLDLTGNDTKCKTLMQHAIEQNRSPMLLQKILKCGFEDFKYAKQRNISLNYILKNFENISQSKHYIMLLLANSKDINNNCINTAIKHNSLDLLNFYFCVDKNMSNKIQVIRKNNQMNEFHVAVMYSNIATIKYLLNQIRNALFIKTKNGQTPKELTANRAKDNDVKSCEIYHYISNLEIIHNNKIYYQERLFYLDAKILKELSIYVKQLKSMYESNSFMDIVKIGRHFFKDQQPDNLIDIHTVDNTVYRSKVVVIFENIAKYINLISNHEGGIKDVFSLIPWNLIKNVPYALHTDYQIDNYRGIDLRKILEKLSPDIFKLDQRISELIRSYSDDANNISFEKFTKLKKSRENMILSNIQKIVEDLSDRNIDKNILENINIVESLNLQKSQDRYVFTQCMQNIGESYKHFSEKQRIFLENNGFKDIKELRDTLSHIWNRISSANKFLKLLESDNTSVYEKSEINKFFNSWIDFLKEYKQILKYGTVIKTSPVKLNNLLDKLSKDNRIAGKNKIDCYINLMKFAVGKVEIMVYDIKGDYHQLRQTLKKVDIHYTCILMLTIIGESVHAIKNEDDFTSLVNYELLRELDFIKWVRNSLMHLDTINEQGTLVDYLSNDLLNEYSIATHGEKVLEFNKYFTYFYNLLEQFQCEILRLGNMNYLQNYNEADRLFINADIKKKNTNVKSIINVRDSLKKVFRVIDFDLKVLLNERVIVEQTAQNLKIEIIGIFGKLAKYGYVTNGDLTGILVDVHDGDVLYLTCKFKQFLNQLTGYRIKVADVTQFTEYLKIKISDSNLLATIKSKLLSAVKKNSLANLSNNFKLIELLLNNYDFDSEGEINNIIDSENVCFELNYCEKNGRDCGKPVLLQLYHLYICTDDKRDNILSSIEKVLIKKADINIQDNFGNTILHYLCENYDEKLFNIVKRYSDSLDCNKTNLEGDSPLKLAIEQKNDEIIEFLKLRTDIKLHANALLIAATATANINILKYLIEHNIDINVEDRYGTPLLHYAIYYRIKENEFSKFSRHYDKHPDNTNEFREVIKLLIFNNVKVGYFYNNIKQNIEIPLMWSLKSNDTELTKLLLQNSTNVDFADDDNIYPIHQAIVNVKLYPELRSEYLKIIETIASKSNDLNVEWKCGNETPLYLAASQNELEILQILVNHGADVNYKLHRFCNISHYSQVVNFFINNGFRGSDIYSKDYAELFNLCKTNLVSLKKLENYLIEKSLNVNAVNSNGQNLFWFAIKHKNFALINWLTDNFSVNINTKYIKKITKFGISELTYYSHIATYANSLILLLLYNKKIIDWNKFSEGDIYLLTKEAFRTDDSQMLLLLLQNRYLNIFTKEFDLNQSKIKSFLVPYLDLFSQIKNKESNDIIETKLFKTNYCNSFFYKDKSFIGVSVKANNLDLIRCMFTNRERFVPRENLDSSYTDLELAIVYNADIKIIEYLKVFTNRISSTFPIQELSKLGIEKKNILIEYFNQRNFNQKIIEQLYERQHLHYKHFSNVEILKILLEMNWDINEYMPTGKTILHLCAQNKYNDCLLFLSANEKIDMELPITNIIIWSTSGYLTAVGFALECNNFTGAKILIENGASPYRYLLVLLLDALRNEDMPYVDLLLEKSVIIDESESEVYLKHWINHGFEITKEEITKAIEFLQCVPIKSMPDYIKKHILNLLH